MNLFPLYSFLWSVFSKSFIEKGAKIMPISEFLCFTFILHWQLNWLLTFVKWFTGKSVPFWFITVLGLLVSLWNLVFSSFLSSWSCTTPCLGKGLFGICEARSLWVLLTWKTQKTESGNISFRNFSCIFIITYLKFLLSNNLIIWE